MSGLIANMLNLSQFLIIGRTSALTYNIISQVKTIVIVSGSWYLERKISSALDVAGVVFAVGGASAYAHYSARSVK
jgi:drug/metabolite transporter (DMT)-like permease